MYDLKRFARATATGFSCLASHRRSAFAALMTVACLANMAPGQIISPSGSVVRRISNPNEKLELTTNTSRILTLEKKIPRVQVNNPDLLTVTPLSATQIQVSAKKAGVTQVNLWDEDEQIHTVDVFIYGDVRELEHALKTQFPNSSIRVYRYSQSLVLTGFIDRPDYVNPIVELAQDYSPKVINNISVGGVQQILLKTKVYEISRTKLRRLGTDFGQLSASGGFIGTSVSGLINNVTNGAPGAIQTITDNGGATVEFGIVSGNNAFFGFLDALQQNSLAKVLAEPNIVAVSGRPAQFNEGGEIPIVVPQSLGTASIEFKKFGTQVDFLPIVLGNGNIRLEVRPRISELDNSNSITLQNVQIPALTVREVDTAVEMKAGQTFALAGLIQRRTESVNRGVPFLADIPIIGVPFRRVEEEVNEVELLILVTPEFVNALEPHEVPPCGPGMGTMSPDNYELYMGGHIEVPNQCNGCGPMGCVPAHGHEPCCPPGGCNGQMGDCGQGAYGAGGCGSAYDQGGYGMGGEMMPQGSYGPDMGPHQIMEVPQEAPTQEMLPQGSEPMMIYPDESIPHGELSMPPAPANMNHGAQNQGAQNRGAQNQGAQNGGVQNAGAQPNGPAIPGFSRFAQRRPQYRREPSQPYRPTDPSNTAATTVGADGLIGPVGYDAE